MNTHIKIVLFCVAIFSGIAGLCSAVLYADEVQNRMDYERFLSVNKAYGSDRTVLVQQRIIKQKKNAQSNSVASKSETAYCLFHKNGQCVRMKTKSGIQYFFSSDQGYWLLTKKLKSPLKISGSYKVEEFEIQDILKIDFRNEYRIADSTDGVLTLERTSSKAAYKFVLFEKTDDEVFELTFTDTKKNPVRTLRYSRGIVDGYECFKQIDIYNLLFDKDIVNTWITEGITPTDVPASLFQYSNMKMLSQKMERLFSAAEIARLKNTSSLLTANSMMNVCAFCASMQQFPKLIFCSTGHFKEGLIQ